MKTTAQRIKEGMELRGFKQADLVEKTGISKGALSSYVSGRYNPKQNNIYLISKALNVSEAWLMGADVPMERKAEFQDHAAPPNVTYTQYKLNDEEKKIIDSLRSSMNAQRIKEFNDSEEKIIISRINSNLVQFNTAGLTQVESYSNDLLKIRDYRREELNEAEIISFKNSISPGSTETKMRLYTYMQKIACAGNGFYFDDIPTDMIKAPYMEGADFIIGVNGDSMEPLFFDGDMVYVEKCQMVETGDIGIFIVNNECYIKEAGEDGLVSHNPKYRTIPGTEEIQCVGRVLGKVLINRTKSESEEAIRLSQSLSPDITRQKIVR